jgi:hypothetical protein
VAVQGKRVKPSLSNQTPVFPFDEEFAGQMAALAKLPALDETALNSFKNNLNCAAHRYYAAEYAHENTVRKQIERLWRAARRRNAEATAMALASLSAPALRELEARHRNNPINPILPDLDEFTGPGAAAACEAVEQLCELGGGWVDGRMRPSGRRSRTWKSILIVPEQVEHPKQRGAACVLVMWLQVAYEDACGKRYDGKLHVPTTASLNHGATPFVKLVQEVVGRLGAPHLATHASVVNTINSLNAERRVGIAEGMWAKPK